MKTKTNRAKAGCQQEPRSALTPELRAAMISVALDWGYRNEVMTDAQMIKVLIEALRRLDRACGIIWKPAELDKFIAEIYAEIYQRAAKVCEWKEDDDGNWETGCGEIFTFTDGGPEENRQNHCGYCGGKLSQQNASVEARQ
jgi:hypothetical protein